MSTLTAKFKSLKLELGVDLIMHLVLISLPTHFTLWSQSLDIVKSFKAEVELQLEKKIKVVKSDCGGEYYGRYVGPGEQCSRHFALFLRECGIILQYTMSSKPSINVLPQTPIEQPQQPQEVSLRRSIRERGHAIPDDYIVFLQEHEDDNGLTEDDPINFCQAMQSFNSQKWIDAMKDELKSMQDNDVWDLVKLPECVKPISCKLIFKTKKDYKGNIEGYKAHLIAKGFTQKEGIDYKETFSLVSSKDSFRIIMALVAHFDLELHQMDVKTAFLNGDIDEMIYLMRPENFVSNEFKYMICKLKKFIYDPQTGFPTMILRDRSQGILRLSQENYISKVLERFGMKDSKPGDTPIAKGDKFSLKQCPNNDLERNEMQKIPYVSAIGSIMYTQVYTRSDIAFMVGVLGRYLSNPRIQHWKEVKRVMRYLRKTKGHMLTYRKYEDLEIIGYSYFDFAGCQNSKRSTFGYIYMLTRGAIS
ncbi:hypothetical protein CR513_24605, partial [Mucuna pruriens]